MTGTEQWKDLPQEIFLVVRIPPEREKQDYWTRKNNRVYKDMRGVNQYIRANKGTFDIYKGQVTWKKQ